jgi:hypothetical protein
MEGEVANAISDLQSNFIAFAKGMPAAAISWRVITATVADLLGKLAGTNPGSPNPAMGNIPVVDNSVPPKQIYNLAYSVFLDGLTISQAAGKANLYFKLTANVHPVNQSTLVIRTYTIETTTVVPVEIDYDYPTNQVFWAPSAKPAPQITSAWGPNAVTALAATTIPAPQQATYQNNIEPNFLSQTAAAVVDLVANALPKYDLGELLPWLKFQAPLQIGIGTSHVLFTSSYATLTIGECSPQTVNIVPDPNFPYGQTIPAPTLSDASVDLAVYLPRTRLIDFVSGLVEPAVQVSESGGGVIQWKISGSVGLNSLSAFVQTAQGLSGVISLQAGVNLLAGAKAWVDGPSGIQLSLASASLIGTGQLGADIVATIDLTSGVVTVTLTVTNCQVQPKWSLDTPLGWAINAVGSQILNVVTSNEAQKLTGHVTQLGRWNVLGFLQGYLKTLPPGLQAIANSEGLANVSALIAVSSHDPG